MRRLSLPLAGLLFALSGSASASIVGVCPDGSMFIVKKAEDIPCPGAKEVSPNEVPPIRPQYLPRPYEWEVFQAKQDPHNPYNLVDKARQVREQDAPPDAPLPQATPQVAAAPPPRPQPPAPRAFDLGLSEKDKRDLALIVELSQKRAPATLREGGEQGLVLRLAHSPAFERRVHAASSASGRAVEGPVVLFHARASQPTSFHANLTFAQASGAFHPEREDPTQFGLLDGRLGEQSAGDAVLGYVVLPAELDPGRPLDVYWNDRRLVTVLRP